jgi:hypothetical protein
MEYVCLVYTEESAFESMSQSEKDALDDASLANDHELADSGHLILAQALEPVGTAVTIRVRDGKMSATDGPFAETKEQLGGLVLVEATDLNDAIRIAGNLPIARLGRIEVRPAVDLNKKVRERPEQTRTAGGAT